MDLLGDDDLIDLRKRAKSSDPAAFVDDARRHRPSLPESNRELARWAQDRPAAQPAANPDHCHQCKNPPRMVCKSCDRPSCAAHSWAMLGVCRGCATEDRMKRWHRSTVSDKNWLEGP